jgi:flagellar biosynthetic protein FliQ
MTIVKVLDIIREAFMTMIVVAGPVLIIALVVGLLISILQATTQLQEQTLSFVPKILAVVVALIVFGNFMLNALVGFTQTIFEMIATM